MGMGLGGGGMGMRLGGGGMGMGLGGGGMGMRLGYLHSHLASVPRCSDVG